MKSIKLAIIALLGFSTACSAAKESSKSNVEEAPKAETAPPIVVMYGVRRPVQPAPEIKKAELNTTPTDAATQPEGNAATK